MRNFIRGQFVVTSPLAHPDSQRPALRIDQDRHQEVHEALRMGSPEGTDGFIAKPCNMSELAAAVAEVTDRPYAQQTSSVGA